MFHPQYGTDRRAQIVEPWRHGSGVWIKSAPKSWSVFSWAQGLTNWSSIVFVGYLYAGAFKGDPNFEWLPIDLTLVLALVCASIVIVHLSRSGYRIPPQIGWIVALHVLCLIPVLWTDWSDYAIEKVSRMFTLTLLAMLYPLFVLRDRDKVKKFLFALGVLSFVVCIQGVLNLMASPYLFSLTAYSSDTISFGRIAGAFALLLLIWVLLTSGIKRLIPMGLLVVPLAMIIASGSRGPLIAFIASTAVVLLLFSVRSKRLKLLVIVLVFLVGIILPNALVYAPEGSRVRLVESAQGTSMLPYTSGRAELYGAALETISETPSGVGWGGYEVLHMRTARKGGHAANRSYPHNLILEAFVEGGWLLGVFMIVYVVYVISHLVKACLTQHSYILYWVLALLSYYLIGSMFSSDWNDNKDTFALLAVGLSLLGMRRVESQTAQ